MRVIRILTFITLSLPAFIHAQERGVCATTETELIKERLLRNKATSQSALTGARVTKYVPVTFHLIADDNGNGRLEHEDVLAQLASLNAQFADQDMLFYIDQIKRDIDLTVVYNEPSNPTSNFQMRLKRDPNSADVFVTNNANSGSNIGVGLGYYSPSNDWIVVRKIEFIGTTSTLAHEFGHFFSLLHPHTGWDGNPYDEDTHGNPVSSMTAPNGGQVELQNGSNCSNAGDLLCDTPPDYNFGFGWSFNGDPCAPYNAGTMDPNGDVVDPDEENVMAYFVGCDQYHFSSQQKNMIETDFFSPQRAYLRTGKVPDKDPVTNAVNYLYPVGNEETSTFDNILLDWDDVPGATDYLIMISRLPTFTLQTERFLSSASEVIIPELEPGKVYYWRVWPYNESQTGAGWGETEQFITGMSTAVQEIASVDAFDVYPNPAASAGTLHLRVSTTEDFSADLQVINLSGQKIAGSRGHQFIAGQTNTTFFDIGNVQPGMYILQLSSEKGILNRKIVIQ